MSAVLLHEWRLALARGFGALTSILFLLTVVAIFAFAIGADLPQLARLGPALIWTASLLAALLGCERAFADDVTDGTLDEVRMSGVDLLAYATAKLIARWSFGILPLVAITPIAGMLFAMPSATLLGTTLTLLIGSPALAALSMLGAALSGLARSNAMLGPIVALPLLVPVVIFGAGAASTWGTEAMTTPLLMLAATSLVSTALVPLTIAALLASSD